MSMFPPVNIDFRTSTDSVQLKSIKRLPYHTTRPETVQEAEKHSGFHGKISLQIHALTKAAAKLRIALTLRKSHSNALRPHFSPSTRVLRKKRAKHPAFQAGLCCNRFS
jgi:hypothetical protein